MSTDTITFSCGDCTHVWTLAPQESFNATHRHGRWSSIECPRCGRFTKVNSWSFVVRWFRDLGIFA